VKLLSTKYRIGSFGLVAALVIGVVSVSAGALFHTPNQVVSSRARVFNEGLRVRLPRTSPAFAALEDSVLEGHRLASGSSQATVAAPVESTAVEFLESGKTATSLARQIWRERDREVALLTQEKAARANEAVRGTASLIATATSSEKVINHPTQTIRLSDLKMSREELVKELLLPIAQNDPPAARAFAANMRASAPIDPMDPFQKTLPFKAQKSATPKASTVTQNSFIESGGAEARTEPAHQLVISGQFEFVGGLALTNTADRVVVYRENEEQPYESAAVWMREGRYEIFVEETVGVLVAELRTPHGDVMGRGEIDLSTIAPVKANQYRLNGVNIKMTPVNQGVSGQIVSAYSYDQKTFPVAGAKIGFKELPLEERSHDDGRFEETALLEGSSVIVNVTRAGNWGTLAVAGSGANNRIVMYPDKMMRAFFDLTGVRDRATVVNAAVIWGRITQNGRPIAGARAELMTTSEEIRPVYFNAMMIPDPSLSATSENGLYAFYPVNPGAHAIRAISPNGEVGEPRLFPAEAANVSHVEIETATMHQARIKVFDAFRTDWPLAAIMSQLGNKSKTRITEAGLLRFAGGPGIMVLDANGGRGYERMRLTLTRDKRLIYVPMVQSAWMERMKGAVRANVIPHTGSVVGFIQGKEGYQVVMDDRGLVPESQIVYFDGRGELIDAKSGVPGGGFILFNIPEGFRTVTVQPHRSDRAFATTVLVDPKATNIINHWIR
jgi:hypothetical protein